MNKTDAIDTFNRECRRLRSEITVETVDFTYYSDQFAQAIENYITATGERPPGRKRPGESRSSYRVYNLEWIGESLDKVAENIERQQCDRENKERSRGEWEAMEREHIRSTAEAIEDVEDPTNRYVTCAAWNCANVFVPGVERRADAKYCSRSCAQEQRDARKRYKATGTYFPVAAYEPNGWEYEERKYRAGVKPPLYDSLEIDQMNAVQTGKRAPTREDGEGHSVDVRLGEEGESGPVKTYSILDLPDGHPAKCEHITNYSNYSVNNAGKITVRGEEVESQKPKTWETRRAAPLFLPVQSRNGTDSKEVISMMLKAESLRIVRLVHGCTQEKLAELIGVDRSYISKIEQGHRPLTIDLERKIKHALGINSDRLAEIFAIHERYNSPARERSKYNAMV